MKRTLLLGAALALSACGSGDSRDGIEAEVLAVHHTHAADATAKHSTSHYKTFRREDGMRIDLQRGLLSISPVALEPCAADVAALGNALVDFLLPAAHAHGGKVHAGGLVDVIEPDLSTVVDLGALPAQPGDYCGLVVELLPAPAGTQIENHEAALDIGGQSVSVAPCYYPNTVGVAELPAERTDDNAALFEHQCIQAAYAGAPLRRTKAFGEPIRLDGTHRHLEVTLAAVYDRWFEDIAMERLADDAEEQARFAQQVLETLVIHAAESHAD